MEQSETAAPVLAASNSAKNTTAAALAVEVPAQANSVNNDAASAADQPVEADEEAFQSPASPLNIHSLLNRPFGDVMREIISGFQLKSTAQVSAEQLRYLVFHRVHDKEVLASGPLMASLGQMVREAPGLPAAGSCMAVLAQLGRTAAGRAQLRAEGVVQPVLRFLAMPGALQKPNAEAALLLLQNCSCDKLCRRAIVKAGGIELLLQLLAAAPLPLKQSQPRVAACLTGTLLNLVVGDGEASSAKQLFVKAGGMETACKVLADWGRYDFSPATLRLRLLLADLGKLQQYSLRLHQTALDASTSARSTQGAATSSSAEQQQGNPQAAAAAAAAGAGSTAGALQPPGGGLDVSPEVLAMAGKGIPLGTPRMPASERITAVVLQHGRNNHDAGSDADEEDTVAAPVPVVVQ